MAHSLNSQTGSGNQTADVVVIGAGVFGCGVAFELSKRGLDVIVVEMLSAPGLGSTSSSGAIVRFNYSTVEGVRLAWEGNGYWKNFTDHVRLPSESTVAHENGIAKKISTGLCFLRHDDGLCDLYEQTLTAAGVPFQNLSPAEVVERFPFIGLGTYGGPCLPNDDQFWDEPTSSYLGALSTPDAGYINDPQLVAQNLHTAALAHGARFLFTTRVDEITTTPDRSRVSGVGLVGGSTISAPIVVNVGGPWSSNLVEMAGLTDTMNITTRPMRHEAHIAPSPPGVDFERDGTIFTDLDQGIYFRPTAGNNVFIGSTDPECDGHEWVTNLDTMNREVTQPIWERQTMRLAKRIDNFGIPHQRKGLAEAYDVSTDWGPIYDRTDLDGFYCVMGTSGNQFKNACVASHLMAELVVAVTDGHDHDTDPLTVTGIHTGVELDMGAFSRNREVNAKSTGSVMG
ncbi:FAD-binding oxidoreductase [Acidimicrobium ferrooxidans]|uniref:FAD-binding oxidoreductase n=1 Tax=Acidimicrobium ferrooxidans TaxID=53635 RepID=A0ABS3AS76_9ACTN|nr:FAD-binding oxidoreductase [Acidimicrobium ferrooxidans]